MSIKIIEKGIARPVLLCDICNKEIKDAKDGRYFWGKSPEEAGEPEDMYMTHYSCGEPTVNGSKLYGAESIGSLIVFLKNNLNVDIEREEKIAELLNSIG